MEKKQLVQKIIKRDAVVGVIGLGYVGLPLLLRFVEEGFPVIGFDVDQVKVDKLNDSESYINHISKESIAEAVEQGFLATTDFSKVSEADVLIVCVPTPLNKYREPDLHFVTDTIEAVIPHLRAGQLISLESTTYPGTTEEEIKARVEAAGFRVGEQVFVVYSPEREDPANKQFTTRTIPKLCGGMTDACLEVGATLYEAVIEQVVRLSSARAAEMTKLLENIHRAVNIGLVNEMKILCDRMDIDIYEVIRAAATKPFGFTPYYPGPGLGGHCIPIDPFYLTWKAREYGLNTRFIELAGEVNTSMPQWVISKIVDALNNREKSLKSSRVLVLGISYKKDVDDTRESPSIELMEILRSKGAEVDYSDPFIPKFPKLRNHYFDLESVLLTPETLQRYDLVLLATNHSDFDYEMIRQNSQLIVDTRGVYRDEANVIRA